MKVSITKPATFVMLMAVLGGPPLLRIVSRRILGDSPGVGGMLLFDLIYWAMFVGLLAVIIYVEKRPLTSIGLKTPGISTIIWGLVLVLIINFMIGPAAMWMVAKSGLSGYEHGLTQIVGLPIWYRVFLAVSAGVIEETFYRGYAIERLAFLTESYRLGALISVFIFGLAHIPGWGIGPALVFIVDGAIAALFYMWKRDLTALIIAHAIGDTIGLAVLPPVASG